MADKKRHPHILPRQIPPKLIAGEYAKALVRAFIVPVCQAYEPVLTAVREACSSAEKAKAAERERKDTDYAKKIRALLAAGAKKIGRSFDQKALAALAQKFATQTQTYQRIQLARQVKAAIGADPLIHDARLSQRVGTFIRHNVSLVKRIPVELHDDLAEMVDEGALSGWLAPDFAETMAERFGIAERHARLIANDQVGSLYADVNHDRQREMGVEKFIWRTVHDERVRGDPDGIYPKALPSHFDLDGLIFSYDDPPQPEGADEPILPGDEINCRCWSEPILSDLQEEWEGEGDDEGGEEAEDDDDGDDRGDSADQMDFDENQPRAANGEEENMKPEDIKAVAAEVIRQLRSDFNPDQERDKDGKFSSGSDGGDSGAQLKLFKDTQAKFKNPTTGRWAAERQQIHEAYTKAITTGVPKAVHPIVYMTGGGPAAGKTSALLHNKALSIPDKTQAVHVSADEAKKYIPEYNEMVSHGDPRAAGFAHEESSFMSKKTTEAALRASHNTVVDAIGDSGIDKLSEKVAKFRADGATRVVAAYATVDPAEAIRRSDKRAETPGPDFGRFVDHEVIAQAHADVAKTFQAAIKKGIFDEATLWNNDGKEPALVAKYRKDVGLTVENRKAWADFQKLGEGGHS